MSIETSRRHDTLNTHRPEPIGLWSVGFSLYIKRGWLKWYNAAMKKYALPIGIGIAVLAVVGLVLFAPKANDYTSSGTNTSATPSAQVEQGTGTQASAGTYIDYSENSIANASGTKILFFHAPWCPQCKALDASIKAGPIPSGATIIKVDYDSNQALRKKYGVTTQTTLVLVDDNGGLVKKYVAYSTPSLDALITNLL